MLRLVLSIDALGLERSERGFESQFHTQPIALGDRHLQQSAQSEQSAVFDSQSGDVSPTDRDLQVTDLIREAKIYAFGRKAVPGSPAPPSPNFELGEFVFDTLILVSRPIDTHDPAPANALDLR